MPQRADNLTGSGVPWVVLDGHGPLHGQVVRAVRGAIAAGRLEPGSRLPPSRAWAAELGLSRWVVTEAYEQLKAEGYLVARSGSGTRVAGRVAAVPAVAVSALRDLSPASPDARQFPRSAWRSAMTAALADVRDADLVRPDPAGLPELLHTLGGYLGRVRGVRSTQLHVTNGTRAAVPLVLTALRRSGVRRLGVEDPGWPIARAVAGRHGLVVVPLPVDGDGVRLERLPDVDAVLLTPAHQFPSGVELQAARRAELVSWAVSSGGWIVEDDYDAEFRYDRPAPEALAAIAPEQVIHLGSTSKTLGPALHLGWLAAPARLDGALREARTELGSAVPVLDQAALGHLLRTGAYDKHVRRVRQVYRSRRRAVVEALRRHVPGVLGSPVEAGLHVLWELPSGTSESAVLAATHADALGLVGLQECRVAPGRAGLLIGFAAVAERDAEELARRIGTAVSASAPSAQVHA